MRGPWRRKNFRPRVLLPATAAFALWCFANPTLTSLGAGMGLVACGLALRLWAAGHLVKTDRLTLSGPYRFLRHPLYAGTLLTGAGLIVAAGNPAARVAFPAGLVFFFGYYLPYKERIESSRLEARWGAHFTEYRASVSPLWPRLRGWQRAPRDLSSWSLERVVANDEFGVLLAAGLALAAIAARGLPTVDALFSL
jgi:protein-S-isoprenylcysteine O-methyltransferase Ste14